MKPHIGSPQSVNIALLTVCVDAALKERLMVPTVHLPWSIVQQDFGDYFSALRRPQFEPEVKRAGAILAMVDFDGAPEQALETAAYLHQMFFGRVAIVGLCSHPDADLLVRAMRTGCGEFLKKPLDAVQLSTALERLDQQWTGKMGSAPCLGQVLCLFGAKGGVGTTTIAVHLATALVANQHKRVLLIDNHLQLGHVCLYLGLDGNRYHFQDLIRNVGRLDAEFLKGFIATHTSGLDVLSSPDSYDPPDTIDPDALERTIEFLRGEYDFVLLDSETTMAEINLAVMDRSDQIYLIATPDIGAVRDLSRYVSCLAQNEHTTPKLHVIINRHTSRDAVEIEQIDKAIKLPVEIRIPNNYMECIRAVNAGQPIAANTRSEFSVQFAKWANTLVNPAAVLQDAKPKTRFMFWR